MPRIKAHFLLVLFALVSITGCCARQDRSGAYCPPYISPRSDFRIEPKQPGAGVVYDFGEVPVYRNVRRSLFNQLSTEKVVAIDLREAVCMAASKSEMAEMIEAERHALACQSTNCRESALDLILQGEALEQRNKVGGAAAELFLGLVQIHMQRELFAESQSHIEQMGESIQAARKTGLATADGENELAKGRIRLMKAETELSAAEQKLMYQLNLLLYPDSDNLVVFNPVHELEPVFLQLDVRHQIEIATAQRPGIQSLELATTNGSNIESMHQLLGLFDARLGLQAKPTGITQRLLRKKLAQQLAQVSAQDKSAETRKWQVAKILATRKKRARIEASQALFELQNSLEQLAIANQEIKQINMRLVQLKAKAKIKAVSINSELNRARAELHLAKSDRITNVIRNETAKFKLLQSQGLLIQQCGYELVNGYSDSAGFSTK